RGLAGAARTGQEHELATGDVECDLLQGGLPTREVLADMEELDQGAESPRGDRLLRSTPPCPVRPASPPRRRGVAQLTASIGSPPASPQPPSSQLGCRDWRQAEPRPPSGGEGGTPPTFIPRGRQMPMDNYPAGRAGRSLDRAAG